MADRDHFKYDFKIGNRIVHTGITNNLDRREQEHKQTYGQNGHITQAGLAVTKESALAWEAEQRAKGKPTGP